MSESTSDFFKEKMKSLDKTNGHITKDNRPSSAPPELFIYSKMFPDHGIPTGCYLTMNWGIPTSFFDFLVNEMGFVTIWEELDYDKTISSLPYPKQKILVNKEGYLLSIDTSFLKKDSTDSRAQELMEIIDEILKNKGKITSDPDSKKVLYISDINMLIPSSLFREQKVFEELFINLQSWISKNDVVNNKPKGAKVSMMVKESYDELYFKEFDVTNFAPDMVNADIFYGVGFTEWDKELLKRLEEEKKGVVLFHGHPGTGKTHYIRYLLKMLTVLKKRVIYIPPSMVETMSDPAALGFLTTNILEEERDTILLIEDAEPLLESREDTGGIRSTGISNLLNSTDGLLNDILGLVVMCTFNTDLKNIDKALLRPGRLLARKEFKKIDKSNTKKALEILKIVPDKEIDYDKQYSVAELLNFKADKAVLLHDHEEKVTPNKIGF